jgi:hypothetical protein
VQKKLREEKEASIRREKSWLEEKIPRIDLD